jgi:uncharacterized NAD-dependent epimerase/dehydratase family protein
MMGKKRHLAILAEGRFTPLDAKTAVGVLRYRRDEVAAIVDSTRAGRTCEACVGVGGAIPVVASLEAAAASGADSLLIGVAPQGGELPREWRGMVEAALGRGWDVLSGLHVFLADDLALAELARRHGAQILDVRRPPAARPIAARRAAALEALVVLTVGSDCNVGKMTAALEITRVLEAREVRVGFVATGQTGIVIADHGVAVDAVPSDFAAGVIEELVVAAAANADVVVVEGQGSLHHPGYSGVTLALLHGCCPRAMVLCHQAGRERVRVPGHRTSVDEDSQPWIPPLDELARAYELAASWVSPGRVIGVALNTAGMDESAARAAVRRAAETTGLPATDPVRFGAEALADAVDAERRVGRARASLA